MNRPLLVALLSLAAALPAWAQGGNMGGGSGPGQPAGGSSSSGGTKGGAGGSSSGSSSGPSTSLFSWDDTIESAINRAAGVKCIFVYVMPKGEASAPAAFNIPDVHEAADALRGGWIFARVPYSPDNALLKRLKVTAAPAMIGSDPYANPVQRSPNVTVEAIRSILKSTPGPVTSFRTTIADDWCYAKSALEKGQEAKATRFMIEIIGCGRQGYPEIEQSFAKLAELGRKRLADARDVVALQRIVADFKDAPTAASAEVSIAEAEFKADAITLPILRCTRVCAIEDEHWKEAKTAAKWLLGEIANEGNRRVDAAVEQAKTDRDRARSALRKIQSEFKGTDAATRAAEALKSLN